ncbi:hypothetical protein BJ997_001283 [Cryobacterium roopkundense]|uniref:Uncharacterized protein n=1 Tax=Cryobacterium roopkundense TaxID=1001240 RepID=A0A7W9E4A5_9MICO|nr:hypothetical protein [Cryobacterium roopkundense]
MLVVILALCNNCGFRTAHPTRSRAVASLEAHENETGHLQQLYSTPGDGWIRFRILDFTRATLRPAE